MATIVIPSPFHPRGQPRSVNARAPSLLKDIGRGHIPRLAGSPVVCGIRSSCLPISLLAWRLILSFCPPKSPFLLKPHLIHTSPASLPIQLEVSWRSAVPRSEPHADTERCHVGDSRDGSQQSPKVRQLSSLSLGPSLCPRLLPSLAVPSIELHCPAPLGSPLFLGSTPNPTPLLASSKPTNPVSHPLKLCSPLRGSPLTTTGPQRMLKKCPAPC